VWTGSGPAKDLSFCAESSTKSQMKRDPTPKLPSKSKARMTKAANTPTVEPSRHPVHPSRPAPPAPAPPPTSSSNAQKGKTETKSLSTEAPSKTSSLDLYSSFSVKLPRISEIRQLHREVQQIEHQLIENRIEHQSLKDEIVQLRNIFDSSKPVVDESYLRLSMVRMSLMQLIDDPDTKENHPLKIFIGKKPNIFFL